MNIRPLTTFQLKKIFQYQVAKSCSKHDPYKFSIIDYKTDNNFYNHRYENNKLRGSSNGTYKLYDLGANGGVLQLQYNTVKSNSINHSDIQIQEQLDANPTKITVGPFYTQDLDYDSKHIPILNENIYYDDKPIEVINFYRRDLFDYRSL